MTTSITSPPPIEWFRSPGLTEPTPLTFDRSGRIFGHAALWGSSHRSFPNRRITPPRSRTDYAMYHVGGTLVVGDDGEPATIATGNLAEGGHADTSMSMADTQAFYDDPAKIVATCCVGEDAVGIWMAGAVLPGLDDLRFARLRATTASGDWRAHENGNLELCAIALVNVPGFAIPRARVASGAPLALVAAGMLPVVSPLAQFARRVADRWQLARVASAPAVRWRFSEESLADRVAEAIERRQQERATGDRHAALLAELDDSPAQFAALLDVVDETPARFAGLLAEVDETPARYAELVAAFEAGEADPKG